jgi:GH18 family chitinase
MDVRSWVPKDLATRTVELETAVGRRGFGTIRSVSEYLLPSFVYLRLEQALPRPGAQEHYNRDIGASWSYCPQSKEMVTYDTKEVAIQKSEFVRDWNLGGAMWWESSGDKTGSDSLIATVFDTLKSCGRGIEYKENVLRYPESKYDNLRDGFPNN